MHERPRSGERALLVSLDFGLPAFAERTEELQRLAESAGATVVGSVQGKRSRPDPALFAGSGKVDEIAEVARALGADVVLFNHALSPAQERNLERKLQMAVVDRTTLILDIFAQRAQSHDGKIQVELAQLQHLSTRLIRGWTHLERQRGGIGMRGPGETQLETDRRLIGDRIRALRARLDKMHRQRTVQRRARQRADVFSVALVGYTNAGKSTLFNRLTNAGAYTADQLFATLDTTSRRIHLPDFGPVVISDTVGFIQDLPHTLVAAFRATLEETIHASLLLHVVDSSSDNRDLQIQEVGNVLHQIGAADIPQWLVWNKIDRTHAAPAVQRDDCGTIRGLWLSAQTGAGLDNLRLVLAEAARAHARPQQQS